MRRLAWTINVCIYNKVPFSHEEFINENVFTLSILFGGKWFATCTLVVSMLNLHKTIFLQGTVTTLWLLYKNWLLWMFFLREFLSFSGRQNNFMPTFRPKFDLKCVAKILKISRLIKLLCPKILLNRKIISRGGHYSHAPTHHQKTI